jgi:hypothetical protein
MGVTCGCLCVCVFHHEEGYQADTTNAMWRSLDILDGGQEFQDGRNEGR